MTSASIETSAATGATLAKEMSLLGLVATGVCSMVGAGINVVPIMVQRSVPGIGPYVVAAFAVSMVRPTSPVPCRAPGLYGPW